MCTVTWRADPIGYDVFFNRDELNSRGPELPPVEGETEGMRFLAPRDVDHGGTWLLINEAGITVCLLNDYENPWRSAVAVASRVSRGHVVFETAPAESLAQVETFVRSQPLERTLPFNLFAFAVGEVPLRLQWTGESLISNQRPELAPPFSSSSFRTADVIAQRRKTFFSFVRDPRSPTANELAAYHRQHDPDAGAHSVLMQRPDAATRSLMHVRVSPSECSIYYTPVSRSEAHPEFGATVRHSLKVERVSDPL